MTVKKIRVIDEKKENKEKEKLRFSREKLLELSKKKTFKTNLLPNLTSIKNEVSKFKKEKEKEGKNKNLIITKPEPVKEVQKSMKKTPVIITSKLTKTKNKINNSLNKSKKNKVYAKQIKRKNTKKLNEIEILVLFEHLTDLLKRNRITKISSILNKIKRKQIVQILNYFNIFKSETTAPTPLLRNILFNLLFRDIYIN